MRDITVVRNCYGSLGLPPPQHQLSEGFFTIFGHSLPARMVELDVGAQKACVGYVQLSFHKSERASFSAERFFSSRPGFSPPSLCFLSLSTLNNVLLFNIITEMWCM